jgi:hypothetical protein
LPSENFSAAPPDDFCDDATGICCAGTPLVGSEILGLFFTHLQALVFKEFALQSDMRPVKQQSSMPARACGHRWSRAARAATQPENPRNPAVRREAPARNCLHPLA